MPASVNIVVLQAGDRQFGLVVDEINDTEEIVVKPLSKQLKSVSCFAGATIMGDGHVALILDVLGLAQMTRVVSELREQNVAKQRADSRREPRRSASRGCCSASARTGAWRFRCRWSRAWRSSRPRRSSASPGSEVIQYREQIMPLVRLARGSGLCRRRGQRAAAGHRVLQQRAQRGPGGGRDSGHRRPSGGGAADAPGGRR